MRLNCWLCWPLCAICCQLLLELLGFAAQHLLLPALLRGLLLALALLLGQFLLPLGELLAASAAPRRSAAAAAALGGLRLLALFVLVLLGIQLQIEEAFHVARGAAAAAATAAAALLAEGHLDIAERGFGAQQVLQRLLLGRQRVLPLGALQLVGGRTHGLHGLFHVVDEALEGIAGVFQLAGLHAVGQRLGLVAQFGLHARPGTRRSRRRCPWRPAPLIWFQVAVMISFCRCEIWFCCLVAAAAAAAAARLLRLRVVALERLRLDEEHVGAGGRARVLGQRRTG